MANSLEGKAYTVLSAHLESLGLEHDIAFPGSDYPKKGQRKAQTYVQVDHIQNGSIDYAIDEEPAHIQGIFQVTVLTQKNQSITTGQDIAGQIINHFQKDLKLWGDGMFVQIDGRPDPAGLFTDKDRLRFPVSINWQAFETEA